MAWGVRHPQFPCVLLVCELRISQAETQLGQVFAMSRFGSVQLFGKEKFHES